MVVIITSRQDCTVKSPSNGRKVAPESLENVPENAWNDQRDRLLIQEEEKKNDIESQSIKNKLIDSKSSRKSTCQSVEVTIKEKESLILSSSVPHLDNESISLKIIQTVRSKKRKSKFLCPPYFILILSLIEILIYVLNDSKIFHYMIYCPKQGYQAWRFISYMFLHSGIIHLTLNIIIQMLLATPLELEQGWWRCAIVYLSGGVIGGIGASVLQPTLCMVGSSAGVYALLISHVPNVILSYHTVKYKRYRLFAVAVLAISDTASSIAHSFAEIKNVPKIGWAAHCAGAIAGVTVGLIVFTGSNKENFYVRLSVWISIFLLIVLITGGVVYNIIYVID